MTVYVDDPVYPFGRMKMCHMIADTTNELLEMAGRIGVDRKWIQHEGTASEHFDVCKSKRALAVKAGATETTLKDLALMIQQRRQRYRELEAYIEFVEATKKAVFNKTEVEYGESCDG